MVSFAGAPARAQCPDWRARPILYRGGAVNAVMSWDPDGAGPLPPVLVAAGLFDRAGGAGAENVAVWDGASWHSLGSGMDGRVFALAVYNGDLIAAGDFVNAGGTPAAHVARWDGAAWQALGSGISGNVGSFTPGVYGLAARNGELIAGGLFTTAGGVAVNSIARWNGSAWLSAGFPEFQMVQGPFIYALTIFGTDLIAGGAFDPGGGAPGTNIARWDGSHWFPLAGGVGGSFGSGTSCGALAVHNGELIAAGDFTSPGNNVAAWNGSSWRALSTGLPDFGYGLASFGGGLYAGGIGFIKEWDGSQWGALGTGLGGIDSFATGLGVHNNQLFVGGHFNLAGGNVVDSVAHWNGAAWVDDISGVTQDPGGQVSAIAPWGGGVALGGTLGIHSRSDPNSGDTVFLAYWSGIGDAGAFPVGGTPTGQINTFAITPGPLFSSNLIVGGAFLNIFGAGASGIASINDLQPGVTTFGPGFSGGEVRAIVRHNGAIYAAGTFTQSGATGVSRIAQWTGTSWAPLGSGMNGDVNALASFGGQLYAGGAFTTAGGMATGGLARWNGTAWGQVGGNFVGAVNALGVYQNNLVIGGAFAGINSSPNLAGYTGTSYFTYGVGGTNAAVRAVTVSGNDLIVGGDFTTAGGLNIQHIARWNGTVWSQVGSGVDGPVLALARIGNEIHAGGSFGNVRAGAIHSPRWARFSEDGIPWASTQPVPATVNCGQNAAFQTAAATGYSVSYQWRKNGSALSNGPTGTGSTIVQANGPTLFVQGVSQADAGTYDCILSNACGSSVSGGATLTVLGTCPGGCYPNCDGSTTAPVLNVLDFACFLNAFAAGLAYANCDQSTTAPVLNVLDFACFLNRFAAGCS
jgi:hypothetical protein